ncbi:UDP-glucose 6-dehydrogenase [Geobacillus jurassicus]|uniref:UDP-glucose 6-dehydrogenase n=1 Tax=Geobacillus jurassicus TaxID=235932 RepID=A0ABV6GU16_9BACL|nr:UDP-glucose 6-dehydrogenase [Geobacillus jurassicus]
MKKLNWNERCIEHDLEQLPVIKDRRTKEEVYAQLARAQRLARWKRRWLSAAVSAAVLAAAVYAGPHLIVPKRADKNEAFSSPVQTLQADGASSHPEVMTAAEVAPMAVTESGNAMVVALPDEHIGQVVPVAVPLFGRLAPEERLTAALRELDRPPFKEAAAWLDGVKMTPAAGDGRVWVVRVPAGHRVFAASHEEQRLFFEAVVETVRQMGGRSIRFFTGEEEGLHLPSVGRFKTIKISGQKRMYYKNRSSLFSHAVLIPMPSSARSFSEALRQMKKSAIRGLEPVIPSGVEVGLVDVDGRHATVRIHFSTSPSADEAASMAEAVLLTAKEFGLLDVTFEASGLSALGPYPLGERINVPTGPNAALLTADGP